jgi:hypothetical protein
MQDAKRVSPYAVIGQLTQFFTIEIQLRDRAVDALSAQLAEAQAEIARLDEAVLAGRSREALQSAPKDYETPIAKPLDKG